MDKQEAIKIVATLVQKGILLRDLETKTFKFNPKWKEWKVTKRSGERRAVVKDEVIVLKEEIEKLEGSTQRHLQVIGLYFSYRKPDIKTREQLNVAIRRHLRAAKELAVFDDNQIIRGFDIAKRQTDSWVIETAVKMLTK